MDEQNLGLNLHESLQELIGLHRQLLEVVKMEADAISNADVKATFDATSSKEALVHWIYQEEQNRQAVTYKLAERENLPVDTSLKNIIGYFYSKDPELSKQLQTDLAALVVLVERIQTQNTQNGKLVERCMKHVTDMRKNLFGEATNENKTYNQQGQKNQTSSSTAGPRLISKEV